MSVEHLLAWETSMHPLPPAHLRLRPRHNGAHPIPSFKTISRSHPHRTVAPGEDNCPHAPLIYWRAVALTGVFCLTLMSVGIVLAVGSGKRPPAQTEEQVDE